jgi:hypothetical protein
MLLGLIITNLISGYFCKTILRIWMYLLIFSIVVDVFWFLLSAQYFWNNKFVDWSKSINSYLRLTAVLTGVVSFGKAIIAILLIFEYNTD